MLIKTGVLEKEQILNAFPSIDRINKGRVAVIECVQRIPCNPCQSSCIKNAINIGDDINNTPQINFDECSGCGICLTKCPGLAIMLVDGSKSQSSIEFSIPFEFLPLPTKNEVVSVLNREGVEITKGIVTDVLNPPSFDKTPIVRFTVGREFLYSARNIKREV